jgi:PKD repeat protein
MGMAVDRAGHVFIAETDYSASRIQVRVNQTGEIVGTIGSYGTDVGTFNDPRDVAVNSSGFVSVVDVLNSRVQRFRPVPTARFSANVKQGIVPLTVAFANESFGDAISGWTRDFGDGSPEETSENPVHCYTVPGTYIVNLTVTNASGSDSEVKTNCIRALSNPVITGIEPDHGLVDTTVPITNLSGSGFLPGAEVILRKS